jgi:hypothetical protein
MTSAASLSPLGSEFDDFLFAPIREDRNEMPLSVLSALARLNVDPWQEAAKLARLPGEAATQRLTSLIAALPHGSSEQLDPAMISARLIALLPGRASSNRSSPQTLVGVGMVINSRTVLHLIFINVIFMAFMLGAQFIIGSRQPPAQVDSDHTPASSTVFPMMPPSSSGQ